MEEHFVPNVPGQTWRRKNSELHRYQQESELKRKKKQKLYSSLNWTCHLHVVSINESNLKRLEKHKLGFLKGENLSEGLNGVVAFTVIG